MTELELGIGTALCGVENKSAAVPALLYGIARAS
jgi:hypothetical protein